MTLQIGTRLGHYRIVSLLGRGGMADVYRAEDERLGREVALKAVPPEFARDPERVERFEREVRAAAGLTHPNIVTVYEFGQGEGQHFYTMELMPGGDLKARIREHPDGMPAAEAVSVAAVVARALDYAHKRGFVHRDVKPENILFGEDGTPQLTDFGIARAMSEGTRMTATGMSIGSPHYMSPEQARGLAVDGRSDLYSLGVVIYEMLTGRLPFDAGDTLAVAYAHVNNPVPELPSELGRWQPVVRRLLAKSPVDRYGSAGELAGVLAGEALPQAPATRVVPVAGEVVPTRRTGESVTRMAGSPKPHSRLPAALAGVLLALAMVGIGYLALQDSKAPPPRPMVGRGGSGQMGPAPVRPDPPSTSEIPVQFSRRIPTQPKPVRPVPDEGTTVEARAVSPQRLRSVEDNRVERLGQVAEQRDPAAEHHLGLMYAKGTGVGRDDTEAVRWFRRAAEEGNADAQTWLGFMYQTGRGVGQDDAEAVRWYRRAIKKGNANAQDNLGRMYETGRGVGRDLVEAVRWYRRAAEKGYPAAEHHLGLMYAKGTGVGRDDTEAVRWFRRAAEEGNADAQTWLGFMYQTGRGVGQDDAEAVRWYRRAIKKGNANAQDNLGRMYETGRGVGRDLVEAVRWYRRAAEKGYPAAEHHLGLMYAKGTGVGRDDTEAVRWFRRAAEEGNADAQTWLGFMYQTGRGVGQDDAEAVRWYRRAIKKGNANAQDNLGRMYETGRGVGRDLVEAVRWYQMAADQGYELAKKNLDRLRKSPRP